MENSRSLATESFSYSWLTDKQPKFPQDSNEDEDNFNFAITSPSDHDLVHADEIFSDGQIKPVDVSKLKALQTSTSYPATPISLYPSRTAFLADKNLGKWRRSSKKILQKCFRFVKPLLGRSRTSSRVDDLERKVFEVRSLSNSLEASPRTSSAYSLVEWSDFIKVGNNFDIYDHGMANFKRSSPNINPSHSRNVLCDAENSIHEAILYCKRSIEK